MHRVISPVYNYIMTGIEKKPLPITSLLILFTLISLNSCFFPSYPDRDYKVISKNTILIIGDGMGDEQIKAAGYYEYGETGHLSFEDFPYKTHMTTYSANSPITDSAASASAMATGEKVNNGVLSMDGNTELLTLLEIARDEGKMTGLVSTATIVHATPAAFASHTIDRSNYNEIGRQYMNRSRPDVIFGGGDVNLSVTMAELQDYRVSQNATELSGLDYAPGDKYFGFFGTGYMPYMYDGTDSLPELSDMAMKALDLLEESDTGFFLMIEAGRIDHAGHANDLIRNIYEVLELSDTVSRVIDWASGKNDTVVIVTADHETGGLTVLNNNGIHNLPDVSWSTTGHTDVNVPVYIWGENGEILQSRIRDNTDIFHSLVIQNE